jgi:NNP family nitrate/nitrite transporter-like MFS transporter
MEQVATAKSHKALVLNTTAFTVCFAAWILNMAGHTLTFKLDQSVGVGQDREDHVKSKH